MGKFEKSAQPQPVNAAPPPSRESPREPGHDWDHHDLGDQAADSQGDMAMNAFVDMGKDSLRRLDTGADALVRRDNGEILLPFVRYDFAHQNITSSINADSHRLEAGYGPFALSAERYVFRERNPSFTLTMDNTMLLYRMSSTKVFEIDFGLGALDISGTQHTTLRTVALPVKLALGPEVTVEFRPLWAGTLNDYELAVHWGQPYWSVKIGYRTLNSHTDSLHGPFAGFSLHY